MQKSISKEHLIKFWRILEKKQRKEFVILIPLIIIGAILEAFSIGILLPTIGVLINGSSNNPILNEYVFNNRIEQKYIVLIAMFSFMIIFILKVIYLIYINWRQSCFSYDVTERLSERMMNKYLYGTYEQHNKRKTSIMLRNIIEEVGLFTGTGLQPMLIIATEIITGIILISLLLYVDIGSTMLAISIITFFAISYEFIARKHITNLGQNRKKFDEERTFTASQSLQGYKDILLNNKIDFFIKKFKTANTKSSIVGRKQYFLGQVPRLLLELIAALALITFIISNSFRGNNLVEIIPTLTIFAFCAFKLMPSANRILASIQAMQYGLPALQVISEELLQISNNKINNIESTRIQFEETLKLINISFRYEKKILLQNLNLEIKKNKSVGIIGKSGSGKSTLIDLLLGLHNPESGEIVIDNNNCTFATGRLREVIGYVPQSIFLIDDSVKKNIAFGIEDNDISVEKVLCAIKMANLEDLIGSMELGIETMIGERGIRLSGGQRQRIGIARALYKDPEIIIFDEATSALDTETEESLMTTIDNLIGKKTIIMIAHRISTLKRCDFIYELKNGKLNEV